MPYANVEDRKVRDAAYHAARREARNAYNREYYAKNKARMNAQMAEYRATHGKVRNLDEERRNHLLRTYGITVEQYDQMYDAQGGRCAGCGTDQPGGKGRYFHVDHDHATGEIRGLLCKSCNIALGHARDSVEVLVGLTAYLLRSQDVLHMTETD